MLLKAKNSIINCVIAQQINQIQYFKPLRICAAFVGGKIVLYVRCCIYSCAAQ
jgi:hypothetical protein